MFLIASGVRASSDDWLPGTRVTADGDAVVIGIPGRDVMAFAGLLHPDAGTRPHDLLEMARRGAGAPEFSAIKGRYAFAYLGVDGRLLVVNDHAGVHDVYLCADGSRRVVSDDLATLLRDVSPAARALDPQAAVEYMALGLTLNGRTFAREARRMRPGTVTTWRPGEPPIETPYWRYVLTPSEQPFEDTVDQCWGAITRAAERVRALLGERRPRCVLGLSGGLDSRVTAYALRAAGVDVQPYFFGDVPSDAWKAASAVAERLELPLAAPGRNREFPLHLRRSLETRPMADLEWAKYLPGLDALLDGAGALASGHLGDHVVGAWSVRAGWGPEDDAALALDVYSSCARQRPTAGDERVVAAVAAELAAIGGSVAQRKQGFWFHAVNMSIKQCGLFRTPWPVPHLSLFEDIDVIDAALTIPPSWRLRNRFYETMIERHVPELAPARVPVDDGRSNDHKPVEQWLRDNPLLRPAVADLVDLAEEVVVAGRRSTFGAFVDDITAGRSSRGDVHMFFRRLTLSAYERMYA